MKATIIGGAGTLGAASGFLIALHQTCEEVCLIDNDRNLLQSHIMDMQGALTGVSSSLVYEGSWQDLKGSHIVIITAGVPSQKVASRSEFLEGNITIFNEIGNWLDRYGDDSIILTASNPVDVLNFYLHKKFDLNPQKLIGYTLNDSKRFEWAVRNILNLSGSDDVYAPVIGEHGQYQVPLFSHIQLNGQKTEISKEAQRNIREEIDSWFKRYNDLNIQRTTGWSSGVGINQAVKQLCCRQDSLLLGSAIAAGEYGLQNVSIGLPLTVNREGIVRIQEWMLEPDEEQQFIHAAENIKQGIRYVNLPS